MVAKATPASCELYVATSGWKAGPYSSPTVRSAEYSSGAGRARELVASRIRLGAGPCIDPAVRAAAPPSQCVTFWSSSPAELTTKRPAPVSTDTETMTPSVASSMSGCRKYAFFSVVPLLCATAQYAARAISR